MSFRAVRSRRRGRARNLQFTRSDDPKREGHGFSPNLLNLREPKVPSRVQRRILRLLPELFHAAAVFDLGRH